MVDKKKKTGSLVRSVLKLFAWISIILCVLIFIVLPHVVAPVSQKLILEKTSSIPGLENFGLNIENIGLSGIGVGNITTGDSISIDSLFCGYSPLSLMRKRISSLDISGLEIKGVIDGSAPVLADFSVFLTKNGSEENTQIQDTQMRQLALILPFLPPVIKINHSFLTLKYQNSLMSIPFSLMAEIDHKNSHINLIVNLLPMGQKIKISLDADIRNIARSRNQSHIKTLFRSVILDAYNVSWSPVNELISIFVPDADVKLTGKSDITLVMDGDMSKWRLNMSHIGIKDPLEGEVNNIVLNLTLNDFEQLLKPKVKTVVQSTATRSVLVRSESETDQIAPDTVEYEIDSDHSETQGTLSKTDSNITEVDIAQPETDKNQSKRDIAQIETDMNGPEQKTPSLYPAVTAEGSFWFGSDMVSPVNVIYGITVNNDKKWSFSVKGREMWPRKEFTIGAGDSLIKVNAPDFRIDCNGDGASADGVLRLTMGRLLYEKQKIALGGLKFQLPVKYGGNGKGLQKKNNTRGGLKGYFNIDEIQYKGKKVASLKSSAITVSEGKSGLKGGKESIGIAFDGKVNVDALAAAIIVKSTVAIQKDNSLKADFSYHLNPTTVTPDMLRKIYLVSDGKKSFSDTNKGEDILSGMDFNFRLASNGGFNFYDHQMESNLKIDLSNGTFSMPDKKISIRGVNTSLAFNELPSMRSVAGQSLTVEKIDIKDLKISNAKILYTIESSKESVPGQGIQYSPALLVENASFEWCDGKVISESIRFSSSKSDYHMSLFCDRLKLSSILQQVGAFEAEGDGTLNGRIPVIFSGEGISFENGFLYSTPGQGGKIRVSGTEKLTAGIPMDTPQFSQVDLAKEALKNYRYEWARLGFNTQGDQLVVKMEFDGKPENVLPFVYKKDLGSFVRVSGKNAGSHFQGIKIDLNLQLPFNRVLRFGSEMNNLFK
ncbi:MAG: YdbH domain-containing protein [Desulfamplus sp.]|nr:YdbH domain-containing protein [Desulfamplus sp.]